MVKKNHIEQLIHDLCPDGIVIKSLGEVCDEGLITLGRGNVISKIDIASTPGDYPVYSSSGQGNGEMGRYGLYMFTDKRITWSIDGGGRFFFRDDPYYSVTNVCGWLKINQEDVLDIKFVYYVLFEQWTHLLFDYTLKAHPSVIRDIYEIPIPPIEIQKKIVLSLDAFVNLLDNIDTEIQTRERQLELYRESVFASVKENSTEKNTLGGISNRVVSGGTPSRKIAAYFRGSIPWLRTQEVDWSDVYDTEIHITEEAVKNSSAKLIPANCVIVAMYGATAGKACINKIPLTTNQACCNLEIDPKKAYYKYVYYWVCSEYLNIKGMGEGSQNNINGQKVKDYPIPLPSLKDQQAIAAKLDTIEAFIANLQEERALRQQQYEYYRAKLISLLK